MCVPHCEKSCIPVLSVCCAFKANSERPTRLNWLSCVGLDALNGAKACFVGQHRLHIEGNLLKWK